MALRAYCRPADGCFAVVYEHAAAGVWVDFVTCYADGGTVTYTNAPPGGELPQPPGHPKVFLPRLDAEGLYRKMRQERPDRRRRRVRAEEFAREFEGRYADEMRWRESHRG